MGRDRPLAVLFGNDLSVAGALRLIGVEMLARSGRMGARVTETGVSRFPREAGTRTGANPAVILRAVRELFALWRELR